MADNFPQKYKESFLTRIMDRFRERRTLSYVRKEIKKERFPEDSWKRLSEEKQNEYFNKMMNLSDNIMIRRKLWEASHDVVQIQHEDAFSDILENSEGDTQTLCQLWGSTTADIQSKNFDNLILGMKNIGNRLELWNATKPEIQQANLESTLSNLTYFEQADFLKVISYEIKNEYISKVARELLNKVVKENRESHEKLKEINDNDEERKTLYRKISSNRATLMQMWYVFGKIFPNTEDGYKIFIDICDIFKSDNGKIMELLDRASPEIIENNLIDILRNVPMGSREQFSFLGKIRPEILIKKEKFSCLYEINNDGEKINLDVYAKIKELYKLNNDIVHNIYFPFLSDSNLLTKYTDEQLLRITNAYGLQKFIHNNCQAKGNIALDESIQFLLRNDINWIISLNRIWENSNSFGHSLLLDNISKVDIDKIKITDDFKQQFLSILSEKENFFEIYTYEDVCNYTQKRNEICERIFNGDFENIPETMKRYFNNKESYYGNVKDIKKDELYKFALLEHQFGISLDYAKFLLGCYGMDLEELPEKNKNLKDYLTLISEIVHCNNIEEIISKVNIKLKSGEIEPWQGSVDARNAEGMFLQMFEEMYNEVLYDPTNETPRDIPEIYEGTEIKVYDLNHDFYMRCRVEGEVYLSGSENMRTAIDNKDFQAYYNEPSMHCHGNSESFISQDYIITAPLNRAKKPFIVGYSKFQRNQLTNMGPKDLLSGGLEFSIYNESVTIFKSDELAGVNFAEYRTPNQMINNTKGHNEINTERYLADENGGNITKLKPDFVVWIENEISQEPQKIDDFTKCFAAQLGIPIVVINREKILQMEMDKIEAIKRSIIGEEITEDKYKQFADSYKNFTMSQLVNQLIVEYGNNRRSLEYERGRSESDSILNLKEKYFTAEQFGIIMEEIIEGTHDNEVLELIHGQVGTVTNHMVESGINFSEEQQKYVKDWRNVMGKINSSISILKSSYTEKQTDTKNKNLEDKSISKMLMQQYLDEEINASLVIDSIEELKKDMQTQDKKEEISR